MSQYERIIETSTTLFLVFVILGTITGIYKLAMVDVGFLAQYAIKPMLGFFIAMFKKRVCQPKGTLHVSASSTKKILIIGGTRFIGLFLSRLLVKEGHQITLFTRGKAPIAQQLPGESDSDFSDFSSKILHLKGQERL